jgi:16S rRNA (cytosine967-C5)-methyltransferase
MLVLDLAAGAGGKSLALAADMHDRGEILACDTDAKRLAQLAPRARRAGVSIIRPLLLSEAVPEGTFDLVLVDAPCSGSGSWRRNPEAKWRLTPERLDALVALQTALLDRAAGLTRPGGTLVYATCSVLPRENRGAVSGFLSRHPEFQIVEAAKRWRAGRGTAPPPGMAEFFQATPLRTGTDGFFACVLIRE